MSTEEQKQCVHICIKTFWKHLGQNNLAVMAQFWGEKNGGPTFCVVNYFIFGQLEQFNFALAGLLCSICIRRKEKVHKSGLIEQAGPAQDGMDRKNENIIILLKFPLIL